jgi:hypothetical protein
MMLLFSLLLAGKMAYATSYEQTTTVTQTYSESRQTTDAGVIDKAYIKGIPGLLKLIEVVSIVFVSTAKDFTDSYLQACFLMESWFL